MADPKSDDASSVPSKPTLIKEETSDDTDQSVCKTVK
jgi:hypothetical protein